MTPTVGIFFDRASAERAVNNLHAVGLSPKSIHVLVPGSEPLVARVRTSEAEQPGMGKAIAGPAIAIGLVGAVLLSLGGAVVFDARPGRARYRRAAEESLPGDLPGAGVPPRL